jgi:phage repressor protein C with HTH and peptisase S24 domain
MTDRLEPFDAVRAFVLGRARETGVDLKSLSLKLGKNHAYLHNWIYRGTPRRLHADDRVALAELLGVHPHRLRDPGETQPSVALSEHPDRVLVPEYDVRVSAGGGFVVAAETLRDEWPFSRRYLVEELRLRPSQLVILEVEGDSMEPTLRPGDRVLVDRSDVNPFKPGVYVLWDGAATVVKRLQRAYDAGPDAVDIVSDNPLHATYRVTVDGLHVVGRVVWLARRV